MAEPAAAAVADDRELLPETDREFLLEKEFVFEVRFVNGKLHVIISAFEFLHLYVPRQAELMLMLPAGYPNARPDMFWTIPDVKFANGNWPAQSNTHEDHVGRKWQRWSRHFQQDWRSGIDNLRTFVASIRRELAKEFDAAYYYVF